MKKTLLIPFIIFSSFLVAEAQDNGLVTRAIIIDGDTVPIYAMEEVAVYGPIIFQNKHDAIRFTKLIRNVKKAYPYALVVAEKAREYNAIVADATNNSEKKKLMRNAEDELKKEFEDDVKNLTDVQGVILIKLIDRETGNTSYELIKEFRGGIMAIFYQTLGNLFGYDLKMIYDPQGEDRDIEQIVQMIESGQI